MHMSEQGKVGKKLELIGMSYSTRVTRNVLITTPSIRCLHAHRVYGAQVCT